jgi:hypothetical protein
MSTTQEPGLGGLNKTCRTLGKRLVISPLSAPKRPLIIYTDFQIKELLFLRQESSY